MSTHDLLLTLVAILYAIAAVAYAFNFYQANDLGRRVGTACLLGGWVAHSILVLILAIAAGTVPLTREILPSLCAWLVVVVYVYLEWTTQDRSLGALIVPIVLVLHLLTLGNMFGLSEPVSVSHSAGWFRAHVLAYVLAYAALAISCVSAIMYLMLLGEIQAKHLGFFYNRLPSLDVLNQLNDRAATFGFVFLTGGSFASSIWAYQELYRLWVWSDPAFLPILIAWVIYAGHLLARWFAGWQGKRSAFLSIAGFILVILAFPVIGVLFSGQHPLGG
ncbi:MAG: cytochrome c biogenesis protein CcsA [Candidatus Latescibacteria bacterium]|jgi:ABC-type transport system involved in cytochrome c biogenesis permease subunit|nr:cytochrome c biogenesis protein CcsA [Candidatus Latescibacterota bacterium]MBT4136894.1 cytochrome c biogenesis protein CcsA [Candidatus Latescibacterota bacterium]MBT5829084.1 cytochrome c biogenesis protein CcsA [Candidatus Latescibacterota bacterium]